MTTTAPPNLLTKYQDYINEDDNNINEDDNNFDSNNVSKKLYLTNQEIQKMRKNQCSEILTDCSILT